MEQLAVKKLETIDLIRLYGVMDYQWDLKSDVIQWRGPLNRLLSPETPLISGSRFQNLLNSEDFWYRLDTLSRISKQDPLFKLHYKISFADHIYHPVEEKGEIVYNDQDLPMGILGSLRFLDEEPEDLPVRNLAGYDQLTGFCGKEVVLETLVSHLDQTEQSGIPGAYLVATLDHFMFFWANYGIKATISLMKEASEALRQAIRFNDFIGKTSGCCFGIILKECDRWGIIRAANRLITSFEKKTFSLESGEKVKMTLSLGGLVFPGEVSEPQNLMRRAERYLFEAQSLKGGNIAGTPYSTQTTQPELERPQTLQKGARRTRDLKKT